MFQSWNVSFLLIISCSFLWHHVKISIIELYNGSFANGLLVFEPLEVKRRATSCWQPQSYNFSSLFISVKFDSAFRTVIVEIAFCNHLFRVNQELAQFFSDWGQNRDAFPLDYPSFSFFIFRLLRLISKADVVPCMFIYDSSVHETLFIPL